MIHLFAAIKFSMASFRRKLADRLGSRNGEVLPTKGQAAVARITAHTDEQVFVYTFDKVPLVFQTNDGTLYPSGEYSRNVFRL